MESDSVYLPVHGTMKEPAVPLQSQGSTRPKSKKLFYMEWSLPSVEVRSKL